LIRKRRFDIQGAEVRASIQIVVVGDGNQGLEPERFLDLARFQFVCRPRRKRRPPVEALVRDLAAGFPAVPVFECAQQNLGGSRLP
ncbi:MAG: hypothetical protein WCF68_08045, partial [Terriglobales bacterium]